MVLILLLKVIHDIDILDKFYLTRVTGESGTWTILILENRDENLVLLIWVQVEYHISITDVVYLPRVVGESGTQIKFNICLTMITGKSRIQTTADQNCCLTMVTDKASTYNRATKKFTSEAYPWIKVNVCIPIITDNTETQTISDYFKKPKTVYVKVETQTGTNWYLFNSIYESRY